MEKKLFIISDIHGKYDLLCDLLEHWQPEKEQLIFLGDLADRGLQSKEVFLKVKELVEQKQAICLKGNHEDILLQWLDLPEKNYDWYMRNGGMATIESLLYEGVANDHTPIEMAEKIQTNYPDLIAFLKQLPFYYENEYVICVHAGLDLTLDNWKETSARDFIWIREPFHEAKNTTQKYIVFGHTPVEDLHHIENATHLWRKDNKIGMDGGAVFGGSLHGLVFDKNGPYADYQIFATK